jgi:hypothetical protein
MKFQYYEWIAEMTWCIYGNKKFYLTGPLVEQGKFLREGLEKVDKSQTM